MAGCLTATGSFVYGTPPIRLTLCPPSALQKLASFSTMAPLQHISASLTVSKDVYQSTSLSDIMSTETPTTTPADTTGAPAPSKQGGRGSRNPGGRGSQGRGGRGRGDGRGSGRGRGGGRGGDSGPTSLAPTTGIPYGHVPGYLPGSSSLVEELDKRVLIVLRDGRHLIGVSV